MNNGKNNGKITEEDFLKNKAKRKGTSATKSSSKNKSKKKKKVNWILWGILIALAFALLACGVKFVSWGIDILFNPPEVDNLPLPSVGTNGDTNNMASGEDGERQYYTFLATATDAGGSLTDVIMVARFNYADENPAVSILQIPRDTFVKISGSKLYFNSDGTLSRDNFVSPTATMSIKINEVYYRGKNLAYDKITELLEKVEGKSESEIKSLIQSKDYVFLNADIEKLKRYSTATENERTQLDKDIRRDFGITYLQTLIYYNFGIPTDFQAQVNINGFRGVVDAIGGVHINVPQDMHYEDEYQDLYIHLNKGPQDLNGEKAEQFVRFRGYPGGDIARLDAQKLFIDAFFDKLISPKTITKIDDIVKEVQKNLYTDISVNNLLKFAKKAVKMDMQNDVNIITLPGDGEYIGGVSYFVANRNEIINLVNNEFNVFDSDLLDEDFCVIASESIVRPAVSVDEDEESEDDEENDEEGNEEGNDDENSDESQDDEEDNGEDDKDKKDDAENKDDSDVEENNDNNKDTNSKNDENDSSKKEDESVKEEKGDDNTASSSSANMDLLVNMLEENEQ